MNGLHLRCNRLCLCHHSAAALTIWPQLGHISSRARSKTNEVTSFRQPLSGPLPSPAMFSDSQHPAGHTQPPARPPSKAPAAGSSSSSLPCRDKSQLLMKKIFLPYAIIENLQHKEKTARVKSLSRNNLPFVVTAMAARTRCLFVPKKGCASNCESCLQKGRHR